MNFTAPNLNWPMQAFGGGLALYYFGILVSGERQSAQEECLRNVAEIDHRKFPDGAGDFPFHFGLHHADFTKVHQILRWTRPGNPGSGSLLPGKGAQRTCPQGEAITRR
jgi:hypothetical protein